MSGISAFSFDCRFLTRQISASGQEPLPSANQRHGRETMLARCRKNPEAPFVATLPSAIPALLPHIKSD
jgi:hypothetical protein